MSIVEKLRGRHEAAGQTLHKLCVRIAEGKSVSDAKLEEARREAGRSALEVAALIELLQERKAACDSHSARDWDAELAASGEERRNLHAAIEAAKAELCAVEKKLENLNERDRIAMARGARIQNEQRELLAKRRSVLNATGDASDWRLI